jgi:hypothetical protein
MLVNKSDLDDASSSVNINNLTKDKEDAQAVIGAIQDFISTSKEELVGDSFDAIRKQLNNYSILMEYRIKAAEALIQAIKQANTSLGNYMDGEAKLDTDDYESFKAKYEDAVRTIERLTSIINSYDASKSNVSLSSLQSQRAAAEETAKKYKRLMDLLDGLPGADSSAYGSLTSGAADSDSFQGMVGEIVTIRF